MLSSFKKSHEILLNYEEFKELAQELEYRIEEIRGETKKKEEKKEGAEEEEPSHSEAKDESLGQTLAIASVGAIAVGAIVYAILKLRRG